MFALRSRFAVVVVVLGASLATAHAATAKPLSLGCGETITASTTLRADLTNCPNQGIVIGADHVTLNLNGHSIDGDAVDAECPPQAEPCDVGVANPDGHDGIRITGGTIREFGLGVFVGPGAERNRLRNVSLTANTYFGAIFDGTTDSAITHSSFIDTGVSGLLVFDATRARISHNAFSGLHGYAIVLRNGVFDSRISHNAINSSDHGIVLDEGGARNRIDHNTVSNSNGSAIDTGGGARENRFEHNRLIDNGDGFVSLALDTVYRHNVVTGSGVPPTGGGGFGIVLDGAVRNTVEKNVFTGGRGPAMLVVQWESPTPPTDNVLRRNAANSKVEDGIFVDAPAIGTLLERNVAFRSGGDGIDIEATGTTVQRNVAFGNAELGIEAIAGVIDAGGNRAFGNGDRAQCLNVVCSTRWR